MSDKHLKEWDYYLNGKKYNEKLDPPYYETVKLNLDFFGGNQWKNLKSNGMPTPVFNILKRGVQFFVSNIMSSKVKIKFSELEYRTDGIEQISVSDIATNEVENLFDKFEMDNRFRDGLFDAAITGDCAAHYYFDINKKPYGGKMRGTGSLVEGEIQHELVDGTNVYFGNPNSAILSTKTQPYVIISGRDTVDNLKDEAKENRENLREDNDTYDMAGSFGELEIDITGNDEGKAKYIIFYKFNKKTQTIFASKLTENTYIYKDIDTGLSVYPIAWLTWEKIKSTYHGQAVCTSMIPNQIFINRMFAMVMYHLMMSAFPKAVYDSDRVTNWNNEIGNAIEISGLGAGESIQHVAGYLQPGNMSSQIVQVIELAIQYTKECLGINEAMMGDINPENASGKSIIATVKQSVVPLENVKANFYEWVKDQGTILVDMMGTYYGVRPLVIRGKNGQELVDFDFSVMKESYLYTRCDVGASSYWSEIAEIETLDSLLGKDAITTIEYLESLPNGYIADKSDLIDKIKERLAATPMPMDGEEEMPPIDMPQI